jgi:hypothetical protein
MQTGNSLTKPHGLIENMTLVLELFNGIAFGIEHVSGEEEDDFSWMIAVHILCIRACFYKM